MTLLELPEEKLPQNPSQAQIDAALEKEAANIRAKMPPNASLITLCVDSLPLIPTNHYQLHKYRTLAYIANPSFINVNFLYKKKYKQKLQSFFQ